MPKRKLRIATQRYFLLGQSPLARRELRLRMEQLGLDVLMRQRIDPLLAAELLEDIAGELRRQA
ncbi:MAG: hypothetical protein AAF709_15705 [Pseudomonadota bacterium]